MRFSKKADATASNASRIELKSSDSGEACDLPAAANAYATASQQAPSTAEEVKAPARARFKRLRKTISMLSITVCVVFGAIGALNINVPYEWEREKPSKFLALQGPNDLLTSAALHLKVERASLLRNENALRPSLINLALYYLSKGDEAKASLYLEKYLKMTPQIEGSTIFAGVVPENDPLNYDTGTNKSVASDNLSQIYFNQGRFADALRVYESQPVFPPPRTWSNALAIERAAQLYDKLGRPEMAAGARRGAKVAALMPDHNEGLPSFMPLSTGSGTATRSLYFAGRCYAAHGKYEKARMFFNLALDGKISDPGDAIVLRTRMMLPVVSMLAGDTKRAATEFTPALAAHKKLLQAKVIQHNDFEIFARQYAEFLRSQGDAATAQKWEQEADGLRKKADREMGRGQWWKP